MRIGVLGGTFNPPHTGHLIGAQEAFEQLRLDLVLFVPAGVPPHREVEHDPGPTARLELTELAVAGDERFAPSRLELEREGPSFTVDTLRELRARSPADELFLLLGGDQAAALPSWRAPEQLLELAGVAVFEREGWSREAIDAAIAALPGASSVRYVEMPPIGISSTLLRRRVAAGKSIRYLTPDAVAAYIRARGLYGGAAPAAAAALRAGGG